MTAAEGFRNGEAVTYLAPAPVSFRSTDVVNDFSFFFQASYIDLPSIGDLHAGDRVVYETNDIAGSPVGGQGRTVATSP